MPVMLAMSRHLPETSAFDQWAAVTGAPASLPPQKRVPDLAQALEYAFDSAAQEWWSIGKALSSAPSAALAHTPACVANASDFGLMLAWTRLCDGWGAMTENTLLLCDDPWMFRHLAERPGVIAGIAPPLAVRSLRYRLRGIAARCRYALHAAIASLRTKRLQARDSGSTALLVYAHPTSTSDGIDGYFGDLMRRFSSLIRVLHVDCSPDRARALAADGRTWSLHSYGSALFALARLPGARWRLSERDRCGPNRWLVRRAAAQEGSSAQGAAIRWQIHCQRRWLAKERPHAVAWPWENHAWERAFVRDARANGVRTVGYQHSVVGRQMLNYGPASNPDGHASLPDVILCSGQATRDQLADWGVPTDRLAIGGALRFPGRAAPVDCDSRGPIFMALPFDRQTSQEMVSAARRAAKLGWKFLVKDHPMTPYAFEDCPSVSRVTTPLECQKSVAAVVYAATTVGLEAALLNLPTLRFRPYGRIAIDILPASVAVPTTDAESLAEDLSRLTLPTPLMRESIFGAVDEKIWRHHLSKEGTL